MFLRKFQKIEYNNQSVLEYNKLQKCKTQFSFLFYFIFLCVFKKNYNS
jgi:hypothetical protein